ncbi:hypothetical protein EXE41_16205 [Halorubrum sp. SD690R]|uniref:Uncharacterized protein n=1 Tax=Halorubrum ezzemoulense TaxID=337243 RepID=A0A481RBI5_HALEZ|nr:hypothetical protein EO776_00100 [Halorubrum ezzemoulense]TKX36050.1 hypothetical protein EXE52_17100 [Halorubrum sp. CGM4_25_10-8A]TKX42935.1 hypothetical protein EXE41_16205 [Halorubrum sp. SD690R]TKX63168.1 hypothetical protein EXE47_15000 [Halorubrum sp. GN12_10-3_MGM]
MVCVVSGPSSGLDDTERPRLTSDRRLRRSAGGAILILRGPERTGRRVINPSKRYGSSETGPS